MEQRTLPAETILPRIVRDPGYCGGEPRVEGTRVPVSVIVGVYQSDGSIAAVYDAYPHLPVGAVEAALLYYRQHTAEIEALLEELRRFDVP